MTATEKRAEAVKIMKSIKGKNTYSQNSGLREKVFDTPGYGDCSSTVRKVLSKVLGYSIGSNTVNQINNTNKRPCKVVELTIGPKGVPDESKMKPGDCLYFAGTDSGRAYAKYVGHVEMYIGNGQLMGHGSGKGPTVKTMSTYCKSRQAAKTSTKRGNKGLIEVKRFILDDEEPEDTGTMYRVTRDTLPLRKGPGKEYESLGSMPKGTKLKPVVIPESGWLPVEVNGVVRWVNAEHVEQV